MANADIRQLEMDGSVFYPQTDINGLVNNGEYAIEDEPTVKSNNLVKSGGVYTAIEQKYRELTSKTILSSPIHEQYIQETSYIDKAVSDTDGALKAYQYLKVRGIEVTEGEQYIITSHAYTSGYGKYCLYAFYNGDLSAVNLVSLGKEISVDGLYSEVITVPVGCSRLFFTHCYQSGYYFSINKVESISDVIKDEDNSVKLEHIDFLNRRPCFKGAKIIKGVKYGVYDGAYHLIPDSGYYAVLIPMNAISDWDGELYFVDKNGSRLNEGGDNIYLYNLSTHTATQLNVHYNKSINSKTTTSYEYVALVFTNNKDYKDLVYASPTRVEGNDYFGYNLLPASVAKMVRSGNMCHDVTNGVRDYGNSYTLYITTGSITHPIKIDKTKNVSIVGNKGISVVRAFSMYGAAIKLLTVTSGVIDIINDTDIQNYDGDVCIKISSTSSNAKFYVSQDETVAEINEYGILDYWIPSNNQGGGNSDKTSLRTYNLSRTTDYLKNTMVHNSGYVQYDITGYVSTGFIDLGADCASKVISCSYHYERLLFYGSDQSTIVLVDSSHYYEYPIPANTRYAKIVWKTNEASGDSRLDVNQDTLIATNNICIGGSAPLTPHKDYTEELYPSNVLQLWRTVGSNSLKNGFTDKILDSLGDSITEQRTYQRYVARYFGCSYDIHGIGGTQVAGTGENAFWQDVRINALNPQADYITIMGGVNDSSSGYTVGDLTTSNFDTSTFAGALNTVINKIWHRYKMKENAEYTGVNQISSVKDVKIILMTPTYIGGQPTKVEKIKEYAEAVIALGKLWHIPVCDVFFQSNMGEQTEDIYWGTTDKTHPNAEGHKQIAALLINTLKSIEPYYSE